MKRISAMIAGLVMAAGAAAADPVEGMWKTQPDDGSYAHVRMTPCGDKLCGVIQRTFDSNGEYDSPNKGKVLVINMVPQGGGAYEGRVWRPSNDKVYLGKMQLAGNSLKLQGCVAGGLLCSSQTWSRLQ
ncbi:hypothetical protein ATO8_03526 [Roseivivax marinus]|jgi:uncharacterized protein (DUF2147 family)|uniref:DUF2147 domain-containing protein n=1 Tax=Roseivivax marinus TaxID=1379903 RepID=W4HMK8_9RHOB|nr:DUF2147 domain-containing protein [Roseivivax marinus]ETW13929.1 hypothetical protein ATO8_03526 [Roseivivax marinus]UMA63795.1 DUF2147 domain-containing protein [Roseivivax marinus]SEK89577.1 Uncharacterized conserved protein, DUF2147 family [Roseivivax marinus]